MEKQPGWACKLGGAELLGISKVGQTVLAMLMESQIWYQPTGSVGRRLQQRDNGLSLPNARHFSFSLYTTGALQAATLVLELRGSESE